MALNFTKKQLKALGISIPESKKLNKYRSKACKTDGITFQTQQKRITTTSLKCL